MATYTQRLHAFVPDRTYTVADDALLWRDGKGGAGQVAYADLAEVRLSYAPTRVQKNRYFLTLSTGHDAALQISNENYLGLADFQDCSPSYRIFVTELHRSIAAANPGVRFEAGSTGMQRSLHWLLTGFILLVLAAAALAFITLGLYWLVLVKVGIIAYYLPTLKRYLGINKPRRYAPSAIPEEMLPTAPAVA
ncbi:MAG: hypothetical protein PHR30_09100 [Gallionellaceae bacterium]|nr:hypothetical protein [Gallionellaceae bacterium]